MSDQYQYGRGYESLGMLDEAWQEYEALPTDDPKYELAQSKLLILSATRCPRDGAARGLQLLKRFPENGRLASDTALCQHLAADSAAAYRTILQYRDVIEWDSHEWYGFACYASRVGDFVLAAECLQQCVQDDEEVWSDLFGDDDLLPLYRFASAPGAMSIRLALAFAHPSIEAALLAAEAAGEGGRVNISRQGRVPDEFRSHLIVNKSTFASLRPGTPKALRDRFSEWQAQETRKVAAIVRRAIVQARDFVLDRQLEWAVEHAKGGDFFGARHHAMHALRKRPHEFSTFESVLRPLGLGYFFDDVAPLLCEHEDFLDLCCRLMNGYSNGGGDDVLRWTERFGEHVKTSVLGLNACAAFAAVFSRNELALGAYHRIAEKWPQDPMGFVNGAELYLKLGRPLDALELMSRAPQSLMLMNRWHEILRDATAGGFSSRIEFGRFYGQPYWRGVLSIPVYPVYPTMEPRVESVPTCP